jgi:hypothetical protein
MKNIETLNNTWFKQENNDTLNLSGTTNIYGNINVLGKLNVENDFGYVKSVLFNRYTGNTSNIFNTYTGNTQSILNKVLILDTNNNSFNINNYIKLGINNNSPQALVDIFTTGKTTGFRLVDGSQSNGRVFTTDNNGFGTWKPIVNSFRTDLNSNGTLLNHNLNKIPSIVTFYGNDKSLNFQWSYNKSGLNHYNQIFIYSNLELKDVIVNII